jgi:microcystin degradation protein MlrC
MKRPRIAIAGFQHETNTFAPFATAWEDFVKADGWPGLTRGEAVREVFADLNIPISGFMAAGRDWDLVPLVWASAEPAGRVSDDAFERVTAMICDGLVHAGALDGVYLDLHGAMVSESHDDGEGEVLRRVRAVIGPDLPLVASLDFHANLTAAMVDLASALAIFRSYPHFDMAETGARAWHLLAELLDRDAPLAKAWRQLPFLVPLVAQATTRPPLDAVFAGLDAPLADGLVSRDIAMGFPPADIHDAGCTVLAYGRSAEQAEAEAERLQGALLAVEPRLENPLIDEAEAVSLAMACGEPGPVVLADVQDNPGAGASSDTTGLLRALVDGGARGAAVACLWHPEAASAAHEAGLGARIPLALGGRYPKATGSRPFEADVEVEALSDGHFTCTGAMYGGCQAALGPMARLRVLHPEAEVRVVVTSERFQCLDLAVFRHMGIEPTEQRILAVKSTVHFLADFEPIAAAVLFVDSPGAHPCRLDRVTYRTLRPGLRLGPGGPPFEPGPERPVRPAH